MNLLKCCKCGTRTRKFTIVCERCGHRYCKMCDGKRKMKTLSTADPTSPESGIRTHVLGVEQ
jgi:hypothetical protein